VPDHRQPAEEQLVSSSWLSQLAATPWHEAQLALQVVCRHDWKVAYSPCAVAPAVSSQAWAPPSVRSALARQSTRLAQAGSPAHDCASEQHEACRHVSQVALMFVIPHPTTPGDESSPPDPPASVEPFADPLSWFVWVAVCPPSSSTTDAGGVPPPDVVQPAANHTNKPPARHTKPNVRTCIENPPLQTRKYRP
jgi:hypothetical protein